MAYYLGIDVGTSGTKALVMDARAKVRATATAEHELLAPRPGWSEQDPEQWWSATVKAARAAVRAARIPGRQIAGIGLSGQMHGLVLTDGAGKPLRTSIIWNDQRSGPQAAEIERRAGGRARLIRMVGNVAVTSFTLTKLLWVRRHQPRIYDRARHLLLPKDYVRLRLTGEYAGDVSDCSGTLLLDQRRRNWSSRALSVFQVDRDILPPVLESHEVAGRLTRQAAASIGLAAGTPVVAGGGDQAVGAVGNGVIADGLTSAAMGTSGAVVVHTRNYTTDPKGRVQTFCASVPGEYWMCGCVLAAGGSLRWYRNVVAASEVAEARRKGVDPYVLLDLQAAAAPPGCEGLFWLPYLTGERTPHADPLARACWIGIQSRTTRSELVRSVIEGATFAMNDAVRVLIECGLPIRQIRLSGGGARSPLWRRIQADVYGVPCVTLNTEEGPAFGAAILAAVGTGRFKSVREACRAGVRIKRTIRPDPSRKKLYAKCYEQYRRLYPALSPEFAHISALTD
ncbi:MAG TPA: xylulokinase [Phycisphaerae bacterium]|nr:xylulokinase [Phycisphaerae bacterium]